jgi:hypothetical protein
MLKRVFQFLSFRGRHRDRSLMNRISQRVYSAVELKQIWVGLQAYRLLVEDSIFSIYIPVVNIYEACIFVNNIYKLIY